MTTRPGLVPHIFFFLGCVVIAIAAWRATRPQPEESPSDKYARELRARKREWAAALEAANRDLA